MTSPQFILLGASALLVEEWRRVFSRLVPEVVRERISTVHSNLAALIPPGSHFDYIVWPLDGGSMHFILIL